MKAWTDYPFTQLQDEAGKNAPVREIEVLSYDGDKYCRVHVCGHEDEIKAGYIYQREGRFGEVPQLTREQLAKLNHHARQCYSAANCVPCCSDCNYAKREMSQESFKNLVARIYAHQSR